MDNQEIIRARISTTIDKLLLEKFKGIAKIEGRHLNYYIEKGLREILKSHEDSDISNRFKLE